MKKGILVILSLIVSVSISAQGINFFKGSFEEAIEKATNENKKIFVDVYTSWCGPCKMMAKKVFTDSKVGEYYNRHFVCLKLDAEKEKDHGFFQNFKASSFPTVFWLDNQGQLINVHSGFVQPEEFLAITKEAEKSNLNKRLESGKKRWDSGERSPEIVREYVLGILGKVSPEKVSPMVMEYLKSLSEEELKEKDNYYFLRMFMRRPGNDFVFNTLVKNADVYQTYTKNNEFWIDMYRMMVRSGSAQYRETEKHHEYVEMIKAKHTPLTDMYGKILDMEYLLFQKDFKQGIERASEIIAEYGQEHPCLCGQFMYTLIIAEFFKEESVSDELADAVIEWADKALKDVPSKENLMYLSIAHVRKGDYKKAWQLLGGLPFFPEPVLSNAVYSLVDLPVFHRQYIK